MTVCLSSNGPIVSEAASPPTRLVVATIAGVAVVARDRPGAGWRVVGRALEDSHIGSLLYEPTRGGLFAGAHSGGLFFSADDGSSWVRRDSGLTIDHVFSLGCRVTEAGPVLYAGTEPVSLFRSDDYGANWQELAAIGRVPGTDKWTFPAPPHAAHTKSLTFDPRDPHTFFAAIEQGALLHTTDGGVTWRELDSYYRADDLWYRDVHRVVMRPSDPDELYMPTGMGLYHSTDAGRHWERLTDLDFRIGYPDHLVISPTDERVLFMSGSKLDPSTWRRSHFADGVVMRSRDGGRTWAPADSGLPHPSRANFEAMCLAAWPGGFALFVGNTDGEVYVSEDGAESWTRIASGLGPVSKVGHYRALQTSAG
jgi:photosystem II stability/assembly factor-like uncharacterized protein